MGKIDNNKQQKRDSLLESAFSLFINNGFNKTSISDIVNPVSYTHLEIPAAAASTTKITGDKEVNTLNNVITIQIAAHHLSITDFLPNLITASKINAHTQARIPLKACAT